MLGLVLVATSFATPPTADRFDEIAFDQELKVVSTGAEPRTVLAYKPKPGTVATYEVVSTTALDMSMKMPDGSTMNVPMGLGAIPSLVVSMRNTVGQPVANGLVPV